MNRKTALIILAIVAVGVVGVYLFYQRGQGPAIKPPAEGNIICFGDSLTYGTGASEGMDYPNQLSGLIGLPVINAGVPGDTTKDALQRIEKDVLNKSPRIVLITLGGNDLKNRVGKEEAFRNLKEIITLIKAKGAVVVVAGIDIPLMARGFGDAYKQVCEETGSLLIPNIYSGVIGHDDLMSDPIHPNDKGYQIFAERFYAVIKDLL